MALCILGHEMLHFDTLDDILIGDAFLGGSLAIVAFTFGRILAIHGGQHALQPLFTAFPASLLDKHLILMDSDSEIAGLVTLESIPHEIDLRHSKLLAFVEVAEQDCSTFL